ncbi:hypothetical protein CAI21_11465 [Alkalilimnicola ehrlichii]|uniref:BON domain-containing protein n=1 Tax=Alkalilimnicola ehrlichii TaxID=351052 RepID=A0A3E0WGH2_9GAMM|nr:BON domain-containing protein [Alkalilimnicola ehrlichii]RFA29052.1 hypothetical protein CAI21_11465 [Alkalilimnicola ehrlichii]RFA31838.1 hypothetical protein CAL65_21290 [Alkalilimnicola ehrlichii]
MKLRRSTLAAALISAAVLPFAAAQAQQEMYEEQYEEHSVTDGAWHHERGAGQQLEARDPDQAAIDPAEAAAITDDDELTEAINDMLIDDLQIDQQNVMVTVEDGVAYVSGSVDSAEEEERLYNLIGQLPAIDRIETDLAVDPDASPDTVTRPFGTGA